MSRGPYRDATGGNAVAVVNPDGTTISGGGGGGGGAVTIADGASVTLGAKADAKSTATDTTPITAMSVLKQISASVQAPPSQAVTYTDTAPATVNVTTQDSGSSTASGANSQSIITGSPTANSAASFTLSGQESLLVQVTGTWTGTVQSEVSFDGGTTWYIRGFHQTGSSYTVSTATANFSGSLNVAGMTNYRIRATAAMTGTATVRVVESLNPNSIYLANSARISDPTVPSQQLAVKLEDSASASGDTGILAWGVRNDTMQDLTDTDLDYGARAISKSGMTLTGNAPRALKTPQATTITSSTSETTILTAVASTFLDVYGITVSNSSATACKVTIKDATAGTTRYIWNIPAGDLRGFTLPMDGAHPQAATNNNWTLTCGTSVASIDVSVLAVKRV